MEVWVSKCYDKSLVIKELENFLLECPNLYHSVVQDWLNSRFPCCWDEQIALYVDIGCEVRVIIPSECAICLEDCNMIWKRLPCGHMFHRSCIRKWMKNKKTCPLCRREFPFFGL